MWKTLKSVVRPQGRYKLVTSVMSTLTRRCSHRSARCGGGCASYRTWNIPCPGTRRTHRKEPEDRGGDHGPGIQTDLLQGFPDVQRFCQRITTSQISPSRQKEGSADGKNEGRVQHAHCMITEERKKSEAEFSIFCTSISRSEVSQSGTIRTTKWT